MPAIPISLPALIVLSSDGGTERVTLLPDDIKTCTSAARWRDEHHGDDYALPEVNMRWFL
ncbi:MAG: hypothetical protein GYB66_10460 [Chloroflexi bacterium]|nr:hypothetical protein [Chloroflexota bacterium]